MSEKRASPRRNSFIYLSVRHPDTDEEYGRVVDLSATGVLIVTDRPARFDQHVSAIIRMPSGSGLTEGFRCTLNRRWVRRDRNPTLTLVGCVMEIDRAARETVDTLITRYSFGDGSVPRQSED